VGRFFEKTFNSAEKWVYGGANEGKEQKAQAPCSAPTSAGGPTSEVVL